MIQQLLISVLSLAQGPAIATPAAAPVARVAEAAGESFVSSLTRPFLYEVNGKRDPFSPPEANLEGAKAVSLFGPFLALQEVKLDDVKIKGIILDPIRPRALIKYPDPDKAAAFISTKIAVKDYLGENYGIVSAIRDGQVIVVQTLEQGDKKSTTTRTLTIRK